MARTRASLLAGLALCAHGRGQESRPATSPATRLPDVVVEGRAESLVGVAASASEGRVGGDRLRERPLSRAGEVLEAVPGLVVTQHSGSGKANQYYLRGFNLDHGTDFATRVAGMPINLPTHAHGQGYTDLNFLIPELIEGVDFKKGPYFAELGDFSSAGAASIEYVRSLPQSLVHLEVGSFGWQRSLWASSLRVGDGDLLGALELVHDDGPWENEQDLVRTNGVVRYSRGDPRHGWAVTALGYDASWNATDQIPKRAVQQQALGRFGTIDASDGGRSSRYSLVGEWHAADAEVRTKATAYASAYDLDLYSNFTYFLDDPVDGDQFNQRDRRVTFGLELERGYGHSLFGRESDTRVGAGFRTDVIGNSLGHTVARRRDAVVRSDDVRQTSAWLWAANETAWAPWLRTSLGLRGDAYFYDVDSDNDRNSGTRTDGLVSPKAGVVLGPWAATEVYLNGGLGFHSNDARGALTRDDPATPAPDDGTPSRPLVPTKGAEIGVRTAVVPGLQSSFAAFLLDIDSELVFVGDAGTTEASRPSRRYGIELLNAWSPAPWISAEADAALTRSRFRDGDPAGDRIPGSIEGMLGAGVTLRSETGWTGSLRGRYFGPRPLIEDDSVRSSGSMLWNARVAYAPSKAVTASVELLNLFDAKVSDIDYYYTSRLAGEPAAGVDDVHFHPAEPFTVRLMLSVRF